MRPGPVLLCLTLGAAADPGEAPPGFRAWARAHGKRYASERARAEAWANYRANEAAFRALGDPTDGAEYGHTRFSDLAPAEFRRLYLPMVMDPEEGRQGGTGPWEPAGGSMPAAVDWREHGAVTPVKDQSACGSCWAESAVANIESRWFLAHRATMDTPVALSTEEVIECDVHDNACYGGYPRGAYQYAIEHGGLASDADYPYNVLGHTVCLANQTFNATCGDGICDDPPLTSSCDLRCSDARHPRAARVAGWGPLPRDEAAIAAHLALEGPVSVGIDASGGGLGPLLPWLQFYRRGVASPRRCTVEINHAVLLVGYGQDSGRPYWILKNSWGIRFGEAGYFRLIRGARKCGIDTMATTALVRANESAPAVLVV